MPRTPSLRGFVRALRDARWAAARGVPLDEALEMGREALTRRAALRAGAAAAGAALLSACASSGGVPGSGARVVIVGGGIAGLHCAWRLKRLGVLAEVYEGSNRVGGRMFSDRATFGAQSCELGGELVDTGHATMQDLARELELELFDFSKDDPALAKWWAHFDGKRVPEAELVGALAGVGKAVRESLATLRDPDAGVTCADPNGGEALDLMSIKEWLDRARVQGVARRFLDIAYTTEYGLEPEGSSALNLVQMIVVEEGRFEVFGDSDERFRFKDGNDAVIRRLSERLDPGQVRTGERLVAIRQDPSGRLVLTFDRRGAAHEVPADHAVLAIPFTMLRKVEMGVELPPAKKRAVERLRLGMNSKLMIGFRARTWRAGGSNGEVFTDLPFQCSWETSRFQPGEQGILTNFTGGRHAVYEGNGTALERAGAFVADFDRVFPGSAAAYSGTVVRMHWPTQPWTEGAYSSYSQGQYTDFCGAERERVGNLHFCGEHTSLDAQGFMEGGALTGAMAADEIAGDLGLDARAAEAAWGGPGERILARARLARERGRWLPAFAATLRARRGPRVPEWCRAR